MDSEGLVVSTPAGMLARESKDLTDLIISEKDPNKLQDLTNLFKQNQLKKNLLRTHKLNNLLELIDDEVATRIATAPDMITNKDLLGYMNATQQSIQNSFNTFEQLPTIQINSVKNTISVNDNTLSKDSRAIVLNKVNEILSQLNKEDNIIDILEEGDSEDA